jgi:hypothetical protein
MFQSRIQALTPRRSLRQPKVLLASLVRSGVDLYRNRQPTWKFTDLLGSAAFAVVQADLRTNITVWRTLRCCLADLTSFSIFFLCGKKVRKRYEVDKAKSATLELLVENEKGEKKREATEGLMWLIRGLAFTCTALLNAQANKSEELAAAFSKSYNATLKQYHNFVVKGIFAVRAGSPTGWWSTR